MQRRRSHAHTQRTAAYPEEREVLAEESGGGDAAGVQRRKLNARGLVEAVVHLAHRQHVAHLHSGQDRRCNEVVFQG